MVEDVSIFEISLALAFWFTDLPHRQLGVFAFGSTTCHGRSGQGAVPGGRASVGHLSPSFLAVECSKCNCLLLRVLQPIYHSGRFKVQDDICYFGMLGPTMMRKDCITVPSYNPFRALMSWHLWIFFRYAKALQRIWESNQT